MATSAVALSGCGAGVGGWAKSAQSYLPATTSTTPAPTGSPAALATTAPGATPTPAAPLAGTVTTQWGVQMNGGDSPIQSLPLLQQLRPAWIHVLWDPLTADSFVALAQSIGAGIFFITNSNVGAIAQAAARYASARVAWDILNEPDIGTTQAPSTPSAYLTLATSMIAAIKAAAPAHLICVASCSGRQSIDPQWYKAVFAAGLLRLPADAVGYHPYGGGTGTDGGPPFTLITNGYRGLIAEYGGTQQLWNTEWGQASGTDGQTAQLQSLAASIRGLASMGIWLSFRDAGTDGSRESSFGLVDYNYNPKAVFTTAVSVFAS